MKQNIYIRILALQCAVLLLVLTPIFTFGAESSSFKLYSNTDDSDQSPLGSTSYSLDEAGGTWTDFPLTGSTFQIVTAPPEQSSSSSSSSSQSTGGTSGGGGTGGSGANPNAPRPSVPTTPTTSSSASSEEATSSSESSVTSVPDLPDFIDDTPLDANVVPGSKTPSGSSGGGEGGTIPVPGVEECTGNACICQCPILEPTHSAAETIFVEVPIPVPVAFNNMNLSILLLIIAYLLGYSSKSIRPGGARISNQKKRTAKKK